MLDMDAQQAAEEFTDKEAEGGPTIRCTATLFAIGSWVILRLPKEASAHLPTRALTMVAGTINGFSFRAALEPDGRGSHWFRVTDAMRTGANAHAGATVQLELWSTKDWVEPQVPADWQQALAGDPKAQALWNAITPGARWDWIRWIRAVKTPETRQKHLHVALDKLDKGLRRPCCFNRNLCSEPAVSHNWVLLDPTHTTEDGGERGGVHS
jgi:hypothetical protein